MSEPIPPTVPSSPTEPEQLPPNQNVDPNANIDREYGYYAKEREKKKKLAEWEIQKKREFADEIAKNPSDPSECSAIVFPELKDMRWKIIATTTWVEDEVVKARLLEVLGKEELEVKDDISPDAQCKRYLKIFDDTDNFKDKISALAQIDKIKGYDKSASVNNTVVNNKVIVIPRALSKEEWQANAKRQQENIKNGIVDKRAIEQPQEKQVAIEIIEDI